MENRDQKTKNPLIIRGLFTVSAEKEGTQSMKYCYLAKLPKKQ